MKVKNIAFSGFAAAILMAVSGAAQAADVSPVRLASQGYVDTQVGTKQDKLTAANQGEGIKLNMDAQGNLTNIAVDWDSVASNAKVTQEIAGALNEGGVITTAVKNEIDNQIATGAIGDAIDEAVADKAEQSDLNALNQQINAEGTGLAAQIAAAANAASAAQDTADDAAAAASTNAQAITALQTADTELGGRLDTLEAIDHTKYATNTDVAATYATQQTVNALTETVNTKAAQSAVDTLSEKVTALEGADHFTQAEADLLYAGIDTETVAANAASAAAANAAAIEGLQSADTALGNRLTTLETADHFTQGDADALYASKSVQTAVEAEGTGLAATYQLASQANSAASTADGKAVAAGEAAAAAQKDVDALESAVAEANYMSGNNIGAGSYLMMSDGQGGISWSSVVIVDENGADIVLPSDAPKAL